MFKIQTLNKISPEGLNLFPRDNYEVATDINNPDAIIVRSADMLSMDIPASVKIIARAGAGTNNIPIPQCTDKGIVVVNTPGANANAVKELVLLSLFVASRPVFDARAWAKTLAGKGDEIAALAEKGKSQFVGNELLGKTIGIIGLGAIGAMVANACVALGMNVIGYDPFLSVDAAWSLSRDVKKAEGLDAMIAKCDYITIHVPQTSDTKGFFNAERIKTMKNGVKIINLARGGLAVSEDIVNGINSGKIAAYITDFADETLLANDKVICYPHLGASTPEAEDNCAKMAVKQIMDFLENGFITNSVNYPKSKIDTAIPANGCRLTFANKNVPNIIGQITAILAGKGINIASMSGQNRNDIAYNIIDVDAKVTDDIVTALANIDGVIAVRVIVG